MTDHYEENVENFGEEEANRMALLDLDNMVIWQAVWPGKKPGWDYPKPTFEMHVGESGRTWLVPAITRIPNRADHIYVTAYKDIRKKGSGFGGAIIPLPLITGQTFYLNGGWHSRAQSLYEDTGIDCRSEFLTYGAAGGHRLQPMQLINPDHVDPAPQIGAYDRIAHIAEVLAMKKDKPIPYTFISMGGSTSAIAYPD